MRKALLVGIDHYPNAPLQGCVNDANAICEMLFRHHDGAPNFGCKKLLSTEQEINRATLRKHLQELFAHKNELVLFYFAGHGVVNKFGGYLVTQDAEKNDEGVAMLDLLSLANQSEVGEVVIILDCCHSGEMGVIKALQNEQAHLREGVSVLTASQINEAAAEQDGSGLFTTLICEGLEGGAADIVGNVTVAGLYAFVDQALGAWEQRPLFKSHVRRLLPLRKCPPVVGLEILRMLPCYFEFAEADHFLDPSYEPEAKEYDQEHGKIFAHLQKLRATGLVVPFGAEHMYYAAMQSKSCRLTSLGRYYWKLAKDGKI